MFPRTPDLQHVNWMQILVVSNSPGKDIDEKSPYSSQIASFTKPHLLSRVEFYQQLIVMISHPRLLALFVALSLMATPVDAGDTQLFAKFDTCRMPQYPRRAMDASETGVSVIGLLVGGEGAVVETVVLNSSGSRDLDRAAALALSKCAFQRPGSIDKGVSLWTSIVYAWSLSDDPDLLSAKHAAAVAADRGNVSARYHLSLLIFTKAKTDVDRAQGLAMLRNAAELGHARAQFDLARRYEIGKGVEANLDEALRWYRKSAESGDPLAKQRMSLGILLDRDPISSD